MIQWIIDTFCKRSEIVDHPFVAFVPPVQEEPTEEEQGEANVEQTTWGDNKVVDAKVTRSEDGFEFDINTDHKNKLKPIPLDKYDRQVLAKWNNQPQNDKRQVLSANYKLVKPYVLAKVKYKEIALLVNMSVSTIQRIGPRVKDASRERQKVEPPTPV